MKFALAGNPNSGKTTLFNALTGSTARVGNWPGVTVDKRTGVYKKLGDKIDIVDLPGIYSLSPYTPEEVVARNFILKENPDCIINVVDATNLQRNLYLTTQLMETDIPMVVALNMTDTVERNGGIFNVQELERKLGLPVVPISALKNKGLSELMQTAHTISQSEKTAFSVLQATEIGELLGRLSENRGKNSVFYAAKCLEGDTLSLESEKEMAAMLEADETYQAMQKETDMEGMIAGLRYDYIDKNFADAISYPVATIAPAKSSSPFFEKIKTPFRKLSVAFYNSKMGKKLFPNGKKERVVLEGETKSDRADRVLTHRIWGIPLFLLIMFAVFHLTFSENLLFLGYAIPEGSFDIPIIGTDAINSPGAMLFAAMEWATDSLGEVIANAMENSPAWLYGLVNDGLLAGVFSVLSFIPQILCLFVFLSILEDSGYMARVAFIMDRAFRKFGLSGKAFLPLLSCFGCAVPGIMATRTLESKQERTLTVMLAPFFSCGAKLPIWATFAALLYGGAHGDLVVFAMYVIGIAVAILAAILMKKTAFKGETPPFIMELPAYHMPKASNVVRHVYDKLKHYVIRAATIIAAAVIVIWFLTSFNFSFRMVEDSGDSIIGIIAKAFTWLFVPLGFGMGENGWKFVVAAFTGLIAKEMVVATMGTFAGMDGDAILEDSSALAGTPIAAMIATISPAAAFAFMAFNLLSIPCMAAVAAARGELGNKKTFWAVLGFWMATAYLVSLVIYWVGTYWWIGLILAVIIAAIVTVVVLDQKGIIRIPYQLKHPIKSRKSKKSVNVPNGDRL